jgi:hypothetical protein
MTRRRTGGRARCAAFQVSEGLLDRVAVRRKIQEFAHRVVITDHRGFRVLSQHGLREKDSGAAHGGQQRFDARAGLDNESHRKRRPAHIKIHQRLLEAVVVDAEVFLIQIQHQLSSGIVDHDGRGHNLHLDPDGRPLLLRWALRSERRPRGGHGTCGLCGGGVACGKVRQQRNAERGQTDMAYRLHSRSHVPRLLWRAPLVY